MKRNIISKFTAQIPVKRLCELLERQKHRHSFHPHILTNTVWPFSLSHSLRLSSLFSSYHLSLPIRASSYSSPHLILFSFSTSSYSDLGLASSICMIISRLICLIRYAFGSGKGGRKRHYYCFVVARVRDEEGWRGGGVSYWKRTGKVRDVVLGEVVIWTWEGFSVLFEGFREWWWVGKGAQRGWLVYGKMSIGLVDLMAMILASVTLRDILLELLCLLFGLNFGRQHSMSMSDRESVAMQGYLDHFLGKLNIVNSREVMNGSNNRAATRKNAQEIAPRKYHM
ncbi:hypothetical protein ACET3Z_005307 [Daucus carota]